MLKFEGLKKAREEFNNWQGNATIFIDCEDMSAWCDVFDIPNYHADSIVRLIGKDDLYGRNDCFGLQTLEILANEKYKDFKNGEQKFLINDDYNYGEIIYYDGR